MSRCVAEWWVLLALTHDSLGEALVSPFGGHLGRCGCHHQKYPNHLPIQPMVTAVTAGTQLTISKKNQKMRVVHEGGGADRKRNGKDAEFWQGLQASL